MSDIVFAWIAADDPRMLEVHALRHEALFAPFGLPRDDAWDDAGVDRRSLVVLRDGAVIAYTSLVLDGEGIGHLRQVCVQPGVQRAGIGSAMMGEAEAEAGRLGLSKLWLNARKSAEPFYLRLGWSTVSETFPSGRTGIPHVRMEKAVGR